MPGIKRPNRYEVLAGAVLVPALILLLLPFLSYPGDYETMMKVRFREDGMPKSEAFTLPESEAVCSEIQFTLTDGDAKSGPYTKVAC